MLIETVKPWAEHEWPSWVPLELRKQIEGFWLESWGRGVSAWLKDAERARTQYSAPAFGEHAELPRISGQEGETVKGRFVHAWNNIGRVVQEDGTVEYCSYA